MLIGSSVGPRETHNHLYRVAKRGIQKRTQHFTCYGSQLFGCVAQQHRQRQDPQHARGEDKRTRPAIVASQDSHWHEDQQPQQVAAGQEVLQPPPLFADVLRMPCKLGVRAEEHRLLVALAWAMASAAAKEPGG